MGDSACRRSERPASDTAEGGRSGEGDPALSGRKKRRSDALRVSSLYFGLDFAFGVGFGFGSAAPSAFVRVGRVGMASCEPDSEEAAG